MSMFLFSSALDNAVPTPYTRRLMTVDGVGLTSSSRNGVKSTKSIAKAKLRSRF